MMFEVSRMIRAWDEDGALGPPRHAFCRRHGQFCQVAPTKIAKRTAYMCIAPVWSA